MKSLLLIALALCVGCQSVLKPRALEVPALAKSKSASDFEAYDFARVGVLPIRGDGLSESEAAELQAIVFAEFSANSSVEVVLLTPDDLAEIALSDPYQRGFYRTETIIGLSRRYRLDGLLVGTVVHRQDFPPLELNVQMDLVAAETGMAIWSGAIGMQADRPEVQQGLEAFYGNGLPLSDDSWAVALLSPSQFARFGAWQLAMALAL